MKIPSFWLLTWPFQISCLCGRIYGFQLSCFIVFQTPLTDSNCLSNSIHLTLLYWNNFRHRSLHSSQQQEDHSSSSSNGSYSCKCSWKSLLLRIFLKCLSWSHEFLILRRCAFFHRKLLHITIYSSNRKQFLSPLINFILQLLIKSADG